MGNGRTLEDRGAEDRGVEETSSLSIERTGHSPALEGSSSERINLLRDLLQSIEEEEDLAKALGDAAERELRETVSSPGKKLKNWTRFGRSLQIASDYFIASQPEKYSGFSGFLSRSWLKTKSFFGMKHEDNVKNFKFNNNLTLEEAQLSQEKESGTRKFIVKSENKAVFLAFPGVELLAGRALKINNAKLDYKYNVQTKKIEEQKLTLHPGAFSLGSFFTFSLDSPLEVDFDQYREETVSLYINSARLNLNFGSSRFPVSNIQGSGKDLELSVNGFTWSSLSASAEQINVLDILTFSDITFNFWKENNFAVPLMDVAIGQILFQTGGESFNQALKADQVKLFYQRHEEGPDPGSWAFAVGDLNMCLAAGIAGLSVDIKDLYASLKDETVTIQNSTLRLKLDNDSFKNFEASGRMDRITWTKQGMDFKRALLALESEVDMGGIKLEKNAAVEIEKNKSDLERFQVKGGLSLGSGGTFSGDIRNAKLVATKVREDLWDYELTNIDEEHLISAQAKFQAGSFELGVELENITYKDVIKKQADTEQEASGDAPRAPLPQVRERTFKAADAKTSLSLLGIETSGHFTGLKFDGTDWSFSSLIFSLGGARIGSFFSLQAGSLAIIPQDTKETGQDEGQASNQNPDSTEQSTDSFSGQEDPGKHYGYQFRVDNAILDLGFVRFTLANLDGSADPLGAVASQGPQNPALPGGWRFHLKNMETSLQPVQDSLAGLKLSLNAAEATIDTQKTEGYIETAGFNAQLFGEEFGGSVSGLTWDADKYSWDSWSATSPEEIKAGPLTLGQTTFSMQKEEGAVRKKLKMEETGFKFSPAEDTCFAGSATNIDYDLMEDHFKSDSAGVSFAMGGKNISATMHGVNISPETGFDIDDVAFTSEAQDSLSFFGDKLKFNNPSFTYRKENKAFRLGGSLKFDTLLSIDASGASIEKKFSEEDFTGNIDTLKVGISDVSAQAKNVSFTDKKFACTFEKVSLNIDAGKIVSEGVDKLDDLGLGELLGPAKGLLSLGKMLGKMSSSKKLNLKFKPNQLVFENGSFHLTQGEDINMEKVYVNDNFLEGELDPQDFAEGSETKNSEIGFKMAYPGDYDINDYKNKSEKPVNEDITLYSTGLVSVYLRLEAGFGFKYASEKNLKPLRVEGSPPKLKFDGPVKKEGRLFFEAALGAKAGFGSIAGVGAEGYVQGGVELQNMKGSQNEVSFKLEEDASAEKGYSIIESSLALQLNDPVYSEAGVRLKVTLLGKDFVLKELKLHETTFGHITGRYEYDFTNQHIYATQKVVFMRNKGLAGNIAELEQSKEEYEKVLQKVDHFFLYEADDQRSPREVLVWRAQDSLQDVESALYDHSFKYYRVQKDLGVFYVDANKKLIESRDQIKKHEYRIENEIMFQEGLKKWDPYKDPHAAPGSGKTPLPEYGYYDLKSMGSFKKYFDLISKIKTEIEGLYEEGEKAEDENAKRNKFSSMFAKIQKISEHIEEFNHEKPAFKTISPYTLEDVKLFYDYMFPDLAESKRKELLEGIFTASSTGEILKKDEEKEKLSSQIREAESKGKTKTAREKSQKLEAIESEMEQKKKGPEKLNQIILQNLDKKSISRLAFEIIKGDKKDIAGNFKELMPKGFASRSELQAGSFMLSAGTLEKIYSDNSVKKARKEIEETIEAVQKRKKTLLQMQITKEDINKEKDNKTIESQIRKGEEVIKTRFVIVGSAQKMLEQKKLRLDAEVKKYEAVKKDVGKKFNQVQVIIDKVLNRSEDIAKKNNVKIKKNWWKTTGKVSYYYELKNNHPELYKTRLASPLGPLNIEVFENIRSKDGKTIEKEHLKKVLNKTYGFNLEDIGMFEELQEHKMKIDPILQAKSMIHHHIDFDIYKAMRSKGIEAGLKMYKGQLEKDGIKDPEKILTDYEQAKRQVNGAELDTWKEKKDMLSPEVSDNPAKARAFSRIIRQRLVNDKIKGLQEKSLYIYELAGKGLSEEFNYEQAVMDILREELGREKVVLATGPEAATGPETSSSGQALYDAKTIKEMAVHKHVRRHAQSRQDFYREKIQQTEVKVDQYQHSVQEHENRIKGLQGMKEKLDEYVKKQEALAMGEKKTMEEIKSHQNNYSQEAEEVRNNEKMMDPDEIVNKEKTKVNQVIKEINSNTEESVPEKTIEEKIAENE